VRIIILDFMETLWALYLYFDFSKLKTC